MSCEWNLHRSWFDRSAMADLLDDNFRLAAKNTLYRCHDRLLVHSEALFTHLKERWAGLFGASRGFHDPEGEESPLIAPESFITQAVNKERKKDLDLHKVYAVDPDLKKAFDESIMRILALHAKSKPA